ncbi:MAG: hypothetical protein GX927_06435 [Lentisphaerae bacterium]|jgi:hypothetical protein|nr:hypothetical protein [Lentisphaerota bacterium]
MKRMIVGYAGVLLLWLCLLWFDLLWQIPFAVVPLAGLMGAVYLDLKRGKLEKHRIFPREMAERMKRQVVG